MSESIVAMNPVAWRPLVETSVSGSPSTVFVLVSHAELDSLVGRLMQMCELTGDVEQRKALKDEIKMRSRAWLDDLYECSGYDKYQGVKAGAKVFRHPVEPTEQ